MSDGRLVGHYRLEASLGLGAFTEVFRAVDTVRRRTVALKLLKPDLLPGARHPGDFLVQAQLASELVHPHLAWVWETGEDDGFSFIAERFADGPSLAQRLADGVPLSWVEAHQAALQIAQGLDFAHSRGWLHLGLKPQNLLLSPSLGAILTDFGVLRALQAVWRGDPEDFPGHNPRYIPPEVWIGEPPSPASDQYALACLLVEMLTTRPLFDAPTTPEIAAQHQAPLELPYDDRQDLPWGLGALLERALAKRPTDRFPNIAVFAQALEALSTQGPESLEQRALRSQANRARLEAEQQARWQAEEAARLAALEQARREIEERSRLEAQAYIDEEYTATPPSLSMPETPPTASAPPQYQTQPRKSRRLRWVLPVLLVVGLLGFWLNGLLPIGLLRSSTATVTPSPTSVLLVKPSTPTRAASPSPTVSHTASKTLSATRTPTATHTPTLTRTITASPTLTPTPTITPSSTNFSTASNPPQDPGQEDPQIQRRLLPPGVSPGEF